jgi:endonuclease/exonuclease/phosphatase family metal-dependent hydrolase
MAIAIAAAAPNPLAADVSIMTYNVHGLPWPFASGRQDALKAIGIRLAEMRAEGIQPHLVLLQEAFTSDAKAIGREAGYRYAVPGPGRKDRSQIPADATQQRYAQDAHRMKGEGDGTIEDSGLVILSDYPVVDVRRMPYSRFACAGFDCLANKGILLVRVAVPGLSEPLTVIDTHMNSRGASGVRRSRADQAFEWQAVQLRGFVDANVSLCAPSVLAGDLNVGTVGYRQSIIGITNPALNGAVDALRSALAGKAVVIDTQDAKAIADKGKDWMFVRSGTETKLNLEEVAVPFGHGESGKSLSDHLGYVSYFAVKKGAR